MIVLALDIAMHRTGWALGHVDGSRPKWGVFETENWGGHQGRNLLRFARFLDDLRAAQPITHLVMEQVFVDVRGAFSKAFQFNGTQAQMMLSGVALVWAEAARIKQLEANIDDWRKHFLGLNRKPKDVKSESDYWKRLAMKVAAQRDWFVHHHDEAEALGIMDYALAQLDQAYRHRTGSVHRREQLDHMMQRGPVHG